MTSASSFTDFVSLLQWRAQRHPDRSAFRFFADGETETESLSFGQLLRRSRVLATELAARGLSGQNLLLLYPPGLEFIVAFLGCLYAGALPVPAYPPETHRLAHTLARLRSIVADARCPAILTDSLILGLAQNLMQTQASAGLAQLQWLQTDALAGHAAGSLPPLRADGLAFLQYTSGSTARPKGVMISHAQLLADLAMQQQAFGHAEAEPKLVCWVPFYHDMGLVGHLLYTLYTGGETLIMPPMAFLKQPRRWLQLIGSHQANSTGAPNFAYDLCVRKIPPADREGLDLSSLRIALNAAEPVQAETIRRFTKAFAPYGFAADTMAPAYGLAETAVFVSFSPRPGRPGLLQVDADALSAGRVQPALPQATSRTLVACGRSWGAARIGIVANRQLLTDDQIGEIWLQGPHLAAGYWRLPELSAEAFGAQLAGEAGSWLRTGDLGFLHQGELYVTGRRKDLIIIRGRNLYPQDLEHALDELGAPALRPGCGVAIGSAAPELDQPEAVVILQEVDPLRDPAFDPDRLCRRIVAELTEGFQAPIEAVLLVKAGSLPKTSSGKLMRQACRQAYHTGRKGDMSAALAAASIALLYAWTPAAGAPEPGGQSPAKETTGGHRAGGWLGWLLVKLAAVTGQPLSALDPDAAFQAAGCDSLKAVELVGLLEAELGRPLADTLLWDYPSPRALAAFLDANAAPAEQKPAPRPALLQEPVAVIGMACRLPLADDPQAFWRLLAAGRDAIGPVPASRWPLEAWYAPEPGTPGKMYVRDGGFLAQVSDFEPGFFRISPREALSLDPQQRLVLELSWEALAAAGCDPRSLAGSATGVWLGLSNSDYARRSLNPPSRIDAYAGTGNAPSLAAGRVAYVLGLQGPAITLDTACSSSLVAVHQACQSLRLGETDLALAGGVNLLLAPEATVYFCQLQALAADGRCKAFDAAADGFVRSEGGGMVVLKRLADAERDGDTILGLIQASAVNADGASNGLTAPSPAAQQQVLQRALDLSGWNPASVSMIETHGTGTPLGDPIELQALQAVYAPAERTAPLYIGALKSLIGHTESAAGVAGLIKLLLAMRARTVPPNAHFHQLNPRIQARAALRFPTRAEAWNVDGPLRAGLSSFGISGTNAHLLLEAPETTPSDAASGPWVWVVSAHSAAALAARRQQLSAWLAETDGSAADLAYSLRRQGLDRHRLVMGGTTEALRAGLETAEPQLASERPRLGFVFSGQGGQWAGMGRELMTEAVFAEMIARCETAFEPEVDWSLSEVLLRGDAADFEAIERLQPLLFALQVALAALLRSWGICPDVVIGHSMGEVAAAWVAGALSLEDAARVICRRSRLLQQRSGAGGMLFTGLSPADCAAYIGNGISLGVYNAPEATVLTGEPAALAGLEQELAAKGVFTRFVQVNVAAHSPQIDACAEPLAAALAELNPAAATLPLLSTVTGEPLQTPPDAAYWFANLRQPVRFAQAATRALREGVNVWIELGPHPLLLQHLLACARAEDLTIQTLACLRREQSERRSMWLTRLAAIGAGIDAALAPLVPSRGRMLPLPPYPWQRRPYWLEPLADTLQSRPTPSAQELAAAAGPVADTGVDPLADAGVDAGPNPASEPQTMPQALWHSAWRSAALTAASAPAAGNWLVFCDDSALNQTLELMFKARGHHLLFVETAPEVRLTPPFALPPDLSQLPELIAALNRHLRSPLRGVVYAWQPPAEDPPEAALAACSNLLRLLQALPGLQVPPRLYVVSRGGWRPEADGLAASACWGLVRSTFYEMSECHPTQIDIGTAPDPQTYRQLGAELLAGSVETQVVLRGVERLVARLLPGPLAGAASTAAWRVRPDSWYVISGGLGELGLKTATWLIAQGARRLALLSRRGGADQPELASWRAAGIAIETPICDLAEAAQLSKVLEQLRVQAPIAGVFHAAGVLADGLLAYQTDAQFARVFAGKVTGGWLLHRLTRADALDCFVCFGSITGALGMPGQANYAAANSFLAGLCAYRQSLQLPALCIEWGPWQRTTALAGGSAASSERLMLSQYGFGRLDPVTGLAFLQQLLIERVPAAAVFGLALRRLLEALPQTGNLPLLGPLAEQQGLSWRPRLQPATAVLRLDSPEENLPGGSEAGQLPTGAELEAFLCARIARILNLPLAEIGPDSSLRSYGFDSLMALELRAQLKQAFGLELPATERFQSMSIREMCRRLGA